MKILLLAASMAALTLTTGTASAQLTLEDEYPGNSIMQPANIEGVGLKYVGIDTFTNEIKIYNTNHSLWKVIPTYLPQGTEIRVNNNFYTSKYLFNPDEAVEVAISYDLNINGVMKPYLAIINEVGTQINIIPDVIDYKLYSSPEVNGLKQWKLWCTVTDIIPPLPGGNFTYGRPYTQIYALPGQYTGIEKTGVTGNTSNIYPNPMTDAATITYSLPAGVSTGSITILDMTGRAIRNYTISNQFNDLKLTRDDLPSGEYLYTIEAPNTPKTTNKFVVK